MTCFGSFTGHFRLQEHLLIQVRSKKKVVYGLLCFFFPDAENINWAFACRRFWEGFGELQRPRYLLSHKVLMSAIKSARERPWLNAQNVKEYILAE